MAENTLPQKRSNLRADANSSPTVLGKQPEEGPPHPLEPDPAIPTEPPRCSTHSWVETSGFVGRFCHFCGVDEDDHDDPRRPEGR